MSVPSSSSILRLFLTVTPLALGLALCLEGCHLGNAQPPTRVESGLLYSAGQAEFDVFFRELNQLQTELQLAPDAERKLRTELASRLEVTAGATPQILIETVTQRAKLLAEKKTFLRLEMEGLGAQDEADTMVQTAVVGPLDAKAKAFVENATLLARLELRHAANLNKARAQLARLTVHAQALEPSLEPTFGPQGWGKLDEVRRNLLAASRTLPLLSLQATDQAVACEQLVKKLALALTTDKSLTEKNEPPLLTNGTAPKRARVPAPAIRKNNGVAAPKPKSEAPSSDSGDFAP